MTDFSARFLGVLQDTFDARSLFFGDDRRERCLRVPGGTRLRTLQPLCDFFRKFVADFFIHHEAGSREANLACVEADISSDDVRHTIEIWRVAKYELRTFSAKFQADGLQSAVRGVDHHLLSCCRGTGERYVIHKRMLHERASSLRPEARKHREEPRRDARLVRQLRSAKNGVRRQLRWLEDNCVACCERRRDFQNRQHERHIPRRDRRNHAVGLVDVHTDHFGLGSEHLAIQFVDRFGEETDGLGGETDIEVASLVDQAAGRQGFEPSHLLKILVDQIRPAK